MASTSASLSSMPALVFQALASLGSALTAMRGASSSRFFICRVGGRGGAKRSAKREVGGGSGATGIGAPYRDLADDLRVDLTRGASAVVGASSAATTSGSSSFGVFEGVFNMEFGAGFLTAGALTATAFGLAAGALATTAFGLATGALAGVLGSTLAGVFGGGAGRVVDVAFTGTLADALEPARGAGSVGVLFGDRATGVSSQRWGGLRHHNVRREWPFHFDGLTRPGHGAGRIVATDLRQDRHCSRPCKNMSFGRSMPMKTILLFFFSPGAQAGPRSLPMSWCTP